MKKLAVLGSTGSIGRSTLEVAASLANDFKVVGLAAGRNITLLAEQTAAFRPEIVALEREQDIPAFLELCADPPPRVEAGMEGISELAGRAGNDIVVSAITGISGLDFPGLEFPGTRSVFGVKWTFLN